MLNRQRQMLAVNHWVFIRSEFVVEISNVVATAILIENYHEEDCLMPPGGENFESKGGLISPRDPELTKSWISRFFASLGCSVDDMIWEADMRSREDIYRW